MDFDYLDAMIGGMFGMNMTGYFGVRSLEAVVGGIKSLDSKAQMALFVGAGLAIYGYFKYVKGGDKDGDSKKAQIKIKA